ncbi:hypothetical protein Ddye_019009 [Dipteronia dyeriana]|uniref:CCHC-type domain-containing protein n=1 Tax=Dipteronia dyeriana TaxID=168575 RepID=A0AAD9WU12_9ROSI|nr:hypothetical protein Ddye_019009 [Dipteronia dyeriana]
MLEFFVVDALSAYNVILVRPFLTKIKRVFLTKIKFPPTSVSSIVIESVVIVCKAIGFCIDLVHIDLVRNLGIEFCISRILGEVVMMNKDSEGPSSRGMDLTKLVITYGGKWVGNFYEGGKTKFAKVCRNLTYSELSRVVQGVVNIDLTRFSIELRTLVDTGVRLRPARPKIKDDSDVEMLLCDGGHVPEVYVSVVEKVSVQPGHVGVPTVQPVFQSFVQQLTAQFQSGGGSNNVFGSIPTADNVFGSIPTINEDESSILEYNSHSEYGLEDFDEDYIGDGGSREGVNDEATYHHGMSSDSTDGGRRGSVPPVFTGLTRDTFEYGGINIDDRSGTSVSQSWIIPGASNYSFELVKTEESSSCNRLSKGGMFKSKKALKLVLQKYALKDNFEIRVTRSCTGRYEVGCKDPEFSDRSLKPKEIMTDMQVEHELSLLYTKALRAKRLAEQNVFGSPDLSYRLLPAYCHELKRVNHGTELKKTIGCPANCIIISDRSPAIKVVMAKEYPEIPHGLCGFHMNMNLKNRFKSHVVCKLFHEASRAHRQTEFLEKIRELSRVGHPSEWNTPEEVRVEFVLPPDWRPQAGRPRKNRVPSAGEHGRRSRYCTICKKSGHNRQNCVNPPVDQQCNVPNPLTNPRPRQRRKCKSCGQEGHNIRTCPTRPYDNPTDLDNDVE